MIDAAALEAARRLDAMVASAREVEATRWAAFLDGMPDRLRDDDLPALRRTAMRARAAYGPKDSVRDALPPAVTEPFLVALDRLLREINRAR